MSRYVILSLAFAFSTHALAGPVLSVAEDVVTAPVKLIKFGGDNQMRLLVGNIPLKVEEHPPEPTYDIPTQPDPSNVKLDELNRLVATFQAAGRVPDEELNDFVKAVASILYKYPSHISIVRDAFGAERNEGRRMTFASLIYIGDPNDHGNYDYLRIEWGFTNADFAGLDQIREGTFSRTASMNFQRFAEVSCMLEKAKYNHGTYHGNPYKVISSRFHNHY